MCKYVNIYKYQRFVDPNITEPYTRYLGLRLIIVTVYILCYCVYITVYILNNNKNFITHVFVSLFVFYCTIEHAFVFIDGTSIHL